MAEERACKKAQLVLWRKPIYKPIVVLSSPTKVRFSTGCCAWCGEGFVQDRMRGRNLTDRYCSPLCTKRAGKHRRRTVQRGAYVEDVNRQVVFARDDWVCQLCLGPVDRTLDPQHAMAVSLDHIVPLARGGTHEMSNVQTAHRLCNGIKSDRVAA